MKKLIIIPLLLLSLVFPGCAEKNQEPEKQQEIILKTVEIFIPNEEKPNLSLNKNGVSSAATTVYLTPEITGKISRVNVKIGQKVKKGDSLITLGDSLATDIIDLQKKTAKKTKNLTDFSQNATNQAADQLVDSANLGIKTAYLSYQNSLEILENSKKIFQKQYQNTQIDLEKAQHAFDIAKNNYHDTDDLVDELEDDLDDLEDQISDLESRNDPALIGQIGQLKQAANQLEISIETTATQAQNAKIALEIAAKSQEQAENGLELLKANYKLQIQQLNSASDIAQTQYKSAINQLEAALAQAALQKIGAENQTVQANSALESFDLNQNYQTIISPIDGKITELKAQEGNLVSPGTILAKIEDDFTITVKTSLNSNEATLISLKDRVKVSGDFGQQEGRIISISPVLNEITKKHDVEIELMQNSAITPGSFVKINFLPENIAHIFVPLNSIFPKEDKKYVRIVNDQQKVENKQIEIGEIINDFVEITAGLKGNEKVIKNGPIFLEEGEKVKTKNLKITR